MSRILTKPFPKRHNLDSSKPKEIADDNFNFIENGRKPSKQVENTVRKGEIACYEQFILFQHWFQKTCTAGSETTACLGTLPYAMELGLSPLELRTVLCNCMFVLKGWREYKGNNCVMHFR